MPKLLCDSSHDLEKDKVVIGAGQCVDNTIDMQLHERWDSGGGLDIEVSGHHR